MSYVPSIWIWLGIIACIAEAERDRIRERIGQVKADQKARGRYLGGIMPFGFRLVEGELVRDEGQQAAIAEMRAMRVQGSSLRTIADAVNANGHEISHEGVARVEGGEVSKFKPPTRCLRNTAVKRKRLNFCVACGTDDQQSLEHHHLIPRSAGGPDDETNLITLCEPCHMKAHDHGRHNMKALQALGIAKAKADGKYRGRAPTARAKSDDVRRLASEGMTREDIAAQLKIGVASVYRALRRAA